MTYSLAVYVARSVSARPAHQHRVDDPSDVGEGLVESLDSLVICLVFLQRKWCWCRDKNPPDSAGHSSWCSDGAADAVVLHTSTAAVCAHQKVEAIAAQRGDLCRGMSAKNLDCW